MSRWSIPSATNGAGPFAMAPATAAIRSMASRFCSEAYEATDPAFHGRVTVPVLWDKETRRIVNNSEDDICRMFNDAFRPFARRHVDLFPNDIAREQAELSAFIYERVNNGVYRAGFATRQRAYEKAARALFDALDHSSCGSREAVTSLASRSSKPTGGSSARSSASTPSITAISNATSAALSITQLQGYLLDLYQQPGIAETVNFDHIKRHYYITHDDINPTRIVPIGPSLDLTRPHGREKLVAKVN